MLVLYRGRDICMILHLLQDSGKTPKKNPDRSITNLKLKHEFLFQAHFKTMKWFGISYEVIRENKKCRKKLICTVFSKNMRKVHIQKLFTSKLWLLLKTQFTTKYFTKFWEKYMITKIFIHMIITYLIMIMRYELKAK